LSCGPYDFTSRIRLTFSRAFNLQNNGLIFFPNDCSSLENRPFVAVCTVGRKTLLISGSNEPSQLIFENNRVVNMSCEVPSFHESGQVQGKLSTLGKDSGQRKRHI
jgi:hypothetical protein